MIKVIICLILDEKKPINIKSFNIKNSISMIWHDT